MDEAGYDVVGAKPTKKSKPVKPDKPPRDGAVALLTRASSAEHLFEPAKFDRDGGACVSKSTDNSPHVLRRSPVPPEAMGGLPLPPPPPPDANEDLGEAEVGEQDHLYAQVTNSNKMKRKKKMMAENEQDQDGKTSADSAKDGDGDGNGSKRGSLTDSKQEPELDVEKEVGLPSEEIEHESSGANLYAVVSNVSKKKKRLKSASLDSGAPPTDEVKGDGSTPSPPVRAKSAKCIPPKPMPFTSRPGNITPTSPGVDSGVSVSSPGGGQGTDRAKSPIRQAPPIPKMAAAKVPPQCPLPPVPGLSPDDSAPVSVTRRGSMSSRPPAFPPPPPPPSAHTDTPTGDDEDHAYAVVEQIKKPRRSKKHAQPTTAADKMVHMDNVLRSGSGTNPPARAPHLYSTVVEAEPGVPSTNGLVTRSESITPKSHPYETVPLPGASKGGGAAAAKGGGGTGAKGGGSGKKKEKMRQHPALPPRHTPPPPPPPSSSQVVPSELDCEGGGDHQFLFSSHYASNLIKVSIPVQ